MKSWFLRFRISSASDDGRPLPESLRRRIARSADLQRYVQETAALDHALRESPPAEPRPHSLHGSIMRAVRAAGRPAEPVAPWWTRLRWQPAAAISLGLALWLGGIWWQLSRPPAQPMTRPDQALTAPARALEIGGSITRSMPSAMMAPLSEELARVNRDVDNTARFLLASLP